MFLRWVVRTLKLDMRTLTSVIYFDGSTNVVLEFGLTCEYIRERKKRGKASRKDIAQQQAAAVTGSQPPEDVDTPSTSGPLAERTQSNSPGLPEGQRSLPDIPGRSASLATPKVEMDSVSMYQDRSMSMNAIEALANPEMHDRMDVGIQAMQPSQIQTQSMLMHESIPEYQDMEEYAHNVTYQPHLHVLPPGLAPGMQPLLSSHGHGLEYTDSPYSMLSPQSAQTQTGLASYGLPEDSPNMGYVAESSAIGSPEWLLPSPSTTMYPGVLQHNSAQQLRFPVLEPLVPHLTDIMPISLACDLLELYFQGSSSALMQPVSPYVLGYVFRKHSFLRQNNPRLCSPALLASILWIGSLNSESPYLSSTPSARSELSEKLINLTISLLKPLVHQTPVDTEASHFRYSSHSVTHGVHTRILGLPVQDSDIVLRKSLNTYTCRLR